MKMKYLNTFVVALVANAITLAYGHLLTLERFLISAVIIAVTLGIIYGIIFLLKRANDSRKAK